LNADLPTCKQCGKPLTTVDCIIESFFRQYHWNEAEQRYTVELITVPSKTFACPRCSTSLSKEQIEFILDHLVSEE